MLIPRGGGAVFAVLFSLACSGLVAADECPNKPDTEEMRLRKKLFCGYDTNVRPSLIHSNVTSVELTMYVRNFHFDPASNSLDVHTWTVWVWKDQHLTWIKSEYGELGKINVISSDIWVPDIGLESHSHMGLHSPSMPETMCHLRNDGQIICVSPTQYSAPCFADITRWPWDQHECTLRISSFTASPSQINLTLLGSGANLAEEGVENRDWELVTFKAAITNMTFAGDRIPSANFTVLMKRHSGGALATVLIPAFVMAILTLVVFWLDPETTERLCLICVNILLHCLFLQHLGLHIPNNGDKQPLIITFVRDSLLLVGGSLVISLLARRLHGASSSPPAWADTLASSLLTSLPGQIILCGDPKEVDSSSPNGVEDEAPLVGTASSPRTWRVLGTLMDRVAFFVFFLILLTSSLILTT